MQNDYIMQIMWLPTALPGRFYFFKSRAAFAPAGLTAHFRKSKYKYELYSRCCAPRHQPAGQYLYAVCRRYGQKGAEGCEGILSPLLLWHIRTTFSLLPRCWNGWLGIRSVKQTHCLCRLSALCNICSDGYTTLLESVFFGFSPCSLLALPDVSKLARWYTAAHSHGCQ